MHGDIKSSGMGSRIPRMVSRVCNTAFREVGAIFASFLLLGTLGLSSAFPQKAHKALSKSDVIGLLKGEVAPERVAEIARQEGIGFEMTRATEKQLREAGADEDLLSVLRELAPKPAAASPRPAESSPTARASGPPVLMIEVTPGNAEVYVDDEPVGTTSSEGRLKLTRLAAGQHRVRLALTGYRDFEQKVELSTGQTSAVNARLEAQTSRHATQTEPAAGQAGTGTAGGENGASLGVLLAMTPPPGVKGAYISDVVPGGPADRAGLRPGYAILSLEGRSVTTAQQVQQVLATLQPGIVADITYNNGKTIQTTGVRLVSRSSMPSPVAAQPPSTGAYPVGSPGQANTGTVSFTVAHDHGPPAPNYCAGVMTIGNGMVSYRSSNGIHSFDIPLNDIKEAKKNAVYMATLGAFHLRLRKGTVYNFVVINSLGQYQPPDQLLTAIDHAMGKR